MKYFFTLTLLLTNLSLAKAEILFDGYYKVTQFKKHIGFLILRQELDAKTKQFKITSFTKLSKAGFDMTESYQAVSDSALVPISINYLAASDKTNSKTIDVVFKNGKMTGTVVENGKKIKVDQKIEKGVFLSSNLYYLMLNSKEGLKTDSKFDFSAVTEEGPSVMTGQVMVEKKMVTQGSLQLMRVKNKFAGAEYENLITSKGEVVSASGARRTCNRCEAERHRGANRQHDDGARLLARRRRRARVRATRRARSCG